MKHLYIWLMAFLWVVSCAKIDTDSDIIDNRPSSGLSETDSDSETDSASGSDADSDADSDTDSDSDTDIDGDSDGDADTDADADTDTDSEKDTGTNTDTDSDTMTQVGCAGDGDCAGNYYCGPNNKCAACLLPKHCGEGCISCNNSERPKCIGPIVVTPLTPVSIAGCGCTDSSCAPGRYCGVSTATILNPLKMGMKCAACTVDSHCGPNCIACGGTTPECVGGSACGCTQTTDCGTDMVCDTTGGETGECVASGTD